MPFASTSVDIELGFLNMLGTLDKRDATLPAGQARCICGFPQNRGPLVRSDWLGPPLGECFRVKSACGNTDCVLDVSSGFQVIL